MIQHDDVHVDAAGGDASPPVDPPTAVTEPEEAIDVAPVDLIVAD